MGPRRLLLPVLALVLLAPAARAEVPNYSLVGPLQVQPPSPGTSSTVSFLYAITSDAVVPRLAQPTQVVIAGRSITIDVFVEPNPGGFFAVGEQQDLGPLPVGTYDWVFRVHDYGNFEIDVEESGEFIVYDDPGTIAPLSFVMDAREVEGTDGSCTELPCTGPTVVNDAPGLPFEDWNGYVQIEAWNSIVTSSIDAGADWATFDVTSFTDGFGTPGTGRSVFDVLFRVGQDLPYSITGDFEIDLEQVGNGFTRFELRRVIDGQNTTPIVGLKLEGPFEQMPVNEAGTLSPGLYQLYAVGIGCCTGADADWSFEATIGTPPPPEPPVSVPSLSRAGLAFAASALGAVGLAFATSRRGSGRRSA